jgi:hypothetical protein
MLRISQLVGELLASQEELCPMKLKVSALSYVHRASVTDEQCWVLTGENRNIREKVVPMLLCPPQVPHGLRGVITYVISAVKRLRLTS